MHENLNFIVVFSRQRTPALCRFQGHYQTVRPALESMHHLWRRFSKPSDTSLQIAEQDIHLFRHGGAQHLCAEESSFGLLNNLLINTLRGMVHKNGSGLVVDFGVHFCVSDEIDNPLFSLSIGQSKSRRKVPIE